MSRSSRSDLRLDVAELKGRVDLVELVVSHGVELRRSGAQFVGLCPLHDETTPSFYVHPNKGLYHCFGCGAKGDAIKFVMMLDGVGFQEAVGVLSGRDDVRRPARRRAATSSAQPARDAGALWNRLALRDELGEGYLAGRGLLLRDPEVLRFNVGTSGDLWLDARGHDGFRAAFAVRNPSGNVRSVSLRHVGPGEPPPPWANKVCLAGCPVVSAAICRPEIEFLAGDDPEFQYDEVMIVEGGTDFLAATAAFDDAAQERDVRPTWVLAAIGVAQAPGVVRAFAPMLRGRTVLIGLDSDERGEAQLPATAAAAHEVGASHVLRVRPPVGKDWAAAVAA